MLSGIGRRRRPAHRVLRWAGRAGRVGAALVELLVGPPEPVIRLHVPSGGVREITAGEAALRLAHVDAGLAGHLDGVGHDRPDRLQVPPALAGA